MMLGNLSVLLPSLRSAGARWRAHDQVKRTASRVTAGACAPWPRTPQRDTRGPQPGLLADTAAFWADVLRGVDRPSALGMVARLKLDDVAGVDCSLRGANSRRGGLVGFLREVKRDHPRKVILVRVGEFYETWGFDAIVMVQHAGLNPMGNDGVPRAGCPVANLSRTLSDLISAGFSCVVCEEAPVPYSYGARASRKERFVAGVVTPASPVYVHGLADGALSAAGAPDLVGAGGGAAAAGTTPRAVVGLAVSARGLTMVEAWPDLRRCAVMEGLTEEAVEARLASGGFSPPLYVHETALDAESTARGARSQFGRGRLGEAAAAVAAGMGASGVWQRYAGDDPVRALLDTVRHDHAMGSTVEFETVTASGTGGSDRPRPLYLSTAQQVGVLAAPGVVPLVPHLLAPGAPAACRHLVQRLLLHPPPRAVAAATRGAVAALSRGDAGGVRQLPLVPAATLARIITAGEGSHAVFADAAEMLRGVEAALSPAQPPAARAAFAGLVPWAAHEAGDPSITTESLHATAAATCEAIAAVVMTGDEAAADLVGRHRGMGAAHELIEDDESSLEGGSASEATSRLFAACERWRGRVRPSGDAGVAAACAAVGVAAAEVEQAVACDLVPAASAATAAAAGAAAASGRRPSASATSSIVYDPVNQAVWLKPPRGAGAAAAKEALAGLGLDKPRDRYGHSVADRLSTSRVEHAVDAYRLAASDAARAVASALRQLSSGLRPSLRGLVGAATYAAVARAAISHAEEGSRRCWCVPCDAEDGAPLDLRGVWPYWMDPVADKAVVHNDISLSGMALLTGPNMAGKSTACRALAAAALLASSGLLVPARAASVPPLDAILMRQAGGDAPAQGKSAFALEAEDARTVLRDATRRSLVLLDELGRGTEHAAGAALAGAMLEWLVAAGAKGLFATHLHQLIDAPLQAPGLAHLRMETVPDPIRVGRASPTWRIVAGDSDQSLALDVAEDYGLPPEVIARARTLEQGFVAQQRGGIVSPKELGGWQLQDQEQRQHQRQQGGGRQGRGSIADAAKVLSSVASTRFHQLCAGERPPPPHAAGVSCVYVWRNSAGFFYVGESDALASRLDAHRAGAGGKDLETAYVTVEVAAGGKSAARAIEAATIRSMMQRGLPMAASGDARNAAFGVPKLG